MSVYKKVLFIDIEAALHRFGRLYLSLQSILPSHNRHFNRETARGGIGVNSSVLFAVMRAGPSFT